MGVIYRPNEAKVRNLKTKDYLGKAKLIAASDGSNAFTGFAGFEMMNVRRITLFFLLLMSFFDSRLTVNLRLEIPRPRIAGQ